MNKILKQFKPFHKPLTALLCSIVADLLSCIGIALNNITYWTVLAIGVIVFVFVFYFLWVNRYRMLMRMVLVALIAPSWLKSFSATATDGEKTFINIFFEIYDNIDPVYLTICFGCLALMDLTINYIIPHLETTNKQTENEELIELFEIINAATSPKQSPLARDLKITELLNRKPHLKSELDDAKAIIYSHGNEVEIIKNINDASKARLRIKLPGSELSIKIPKWLYRSNKGRKFTGNDLARALENSGYEIVSLNNHVAIVDKSNQASDRKTVVTIPMRHLKSKQNIPMVYLQLLKRTLGIDFGL